MAASSSEHATESLLGRWDVLLPDDERTVFSSFLYICGYNKASSSSCIREYPRSCGYTEKSDCGDLGHLPTVCLLQKSSKIPGLGKNLFVLPMSVGAGARVLAKESHLVILFFLIFVYLAAPSLGCCTRGLQSLSWNAGSVVGWGLFLFSVVTCEASDAARAV